jgi:CheY-like chemotaxis protein
MSTVSRRSSQVTMPWVADGSKSNTLEHTLKFGEYKQSQMSWTLLCVSKSSPAQVTRNLILERAGYRVVSTSDPAEAASIFTNTVVHAVVFGDSLHIDQRLELARMFKRLNSSVPIVALSKTSGTQVPGGLVDEQLESLGDPRLLLEALVRVLPLDGDGQ